MRMEGVRGSSWAEAFPHALLVLSVGPVCMGETRT